MHVECVEIQNYRKLKSCQVELTDKTTIFVGANNSGKTSAMDALIKFLDKKNKFTINDFTLSNWIGINKIGEKWMNNSEEILNFLKEDLEKLVPTMDVWIKVTENEVHYVTHLIPSLNWKGGLIGVRLRLEPKDIEYMYKDFIDSVNSAKETLSALKSTNSLSLWPRNLKDYLNKKFHSHFTVRAYILDPEKLSTPDPNNGLAQPQTLPYDSDYIDEDPFKKLFLVHYIGAQRGFSDPTNTNENDESTNGIVGNLSTQLRKYYNLHLNPTESPDPTDIDALQAIESAQDIFDSKLHKGFENALFELQSLGYPGFSDPRITISTKFKPIDGLNHSSAVQFDLMPENRQFNEHLRLPEQYNGLGYQNLISIIFKMMQFRDEWMKVGKLSKIVPSNKDDFSIPPLHIVLVEEPEAHLHIQVQQVFIRHVYDVLCNHERLGNEFFKTQLIVSTHSGHIAHEMPFSSLRYFRKQPSTLNNEVPISTVVNLSNVFGKEKETERFVTRYLQIVHFDLLFADAVIIVEGPAERMLIPHFIRKHFQVLNQKYISLLEIGGSHAHTLRPLIERLGLTSLIITDLDSAEPINNSAMPPLRNKNYISVNDTLKSWVPCKTKIDDLFDLNFEEKIKRYKQDRFAIKVAYQYPIKILMVPDGPEVEALPYTFEDALVFENLSLFKNLKGTGLLKKFKNAIFEQKTITDLGKQFFDDLRTGKKAEFALQLIYLEELKDLKVPKYIDEGLTWLEEQLQQRESENIDNQNTVEILVEEVV
ncbi:putative ATP-dependent endonuclease of OLD family [Fontibacillus phaseoli]|uniref:Putative ATP-dependent endonuclease of OLD family n=1 Tax=Fontibacillus phaseoli TaxID=1416533 RepID=A0A369BPM1_9BACL|nr:AAA family ATPase [Fontibacillus phaseoli]RCX23331.1 putative ATP-dependent endonuclease of OLD family [Fontibacillus phaseoli]